jgi:hypothetical protein
MSKLTRDEKLNLLMDIIFSDHPPERGTGMSVCVCGADNYPAHLRQVIDAEGLISDD